MHEDVSGVYNIGKEIGYGKYGVVRLVAKKSYDRKRFALKSIPRERMSGDIYHGTKNKDITKNTFV